MSELPDKMRACAETIMDDYAYADPPFIDAQLQAAYDLLNEAAGALSAATARIEKWKPVIEAAKNLRDEWRRYPQREPNVTFNLECALGQAIDALAALGDGE